MAGHRMRVAVVCGDGVPVSGLLTVMRNVVEMGISEGTVAPHVSADLGFGWRPDKPKFYPSGVARAGYPSWLEVTNIHPVLDPAAAGTRLTAIRDDIARADKLSQAQRATLRLEIDGLAEGYRIRFGSWLESHDVDWVFAINMTISDAAPVTTGLHLAARDRWGGGRAGGVVFWEHDLFGTCTVYEHGRRVYPLTPNEFTVLPGDAPWLRWVVVSESLASEARGYGTGLSPVHLPNLLPRLGSGGLDDRHRQFLAQWGIDARRSVLLAPVRIFRPKGVEISLALQQAVGEECRRRGLAVPCLLVFGCLDEDPAYGAELRVEAGERGLGDEVRFLDGVPLGTWLDGEGRWRLDEVD
jgi:hypothetical protein